MNNESRVKLTKDVIEMYNSLIVAIEKAGGNIPKDELLNMTVLDLIAILSTNNIRFVYYNTIEKEIPKPPIPPKLREFYNH